MDEPETPAEKSAPTYPPLVAQAPPGAFGPTSPWVWVSLATSIVALLTVLGVGAAALIFGLGLALDDAGGDGPDYYVDQVSVITAVEEPCADMLDAAEMVTLGGPPARAASSLRRWARSAQGIVTAIDGAHPNSDSRAWREDWNATVAGVEKYADNFGEPTNRLRLADPLEDMYWETDTECGVPVVIAGLDQDKASYMYGE